MKALRIGKITLPPNRDGQWVWLRAVIKDVDNTRQRLVYDGCVGKAPLSESKEYHEIRQRKDQSVHWLIGIELWTSMSLDGALMQFCGACCIDPCSWTHAQSPARWYALHRSSSKKVAWSEGETAHTASFPSPSPFGDTAVGCLHVTATFVCDQPVGVTPVQAVKDDQGSEQEEGDFRLALPFQSIKKKQLLRRLRIGEVVQQRQVDVLQDLMATTLYGKTDLPLSQPSPHSDGLLKAMTLLQLSCQYALHSTKTLEKYTSQLSLKSEKSMQKIHRHRHKNRVLREKKKTLTQELSVVESVLDGMGVMLQELDPLLYQRMVDARLPHSS